jgi:restriction endonuclease
MLDFTEIPSGDAFEDLIEEFLHISGMNPIRSGEGPDRGRDFLATEVVGGQLSTEIERLWVVECKHGASSKRSVSENDIGMISGIVSKHEADGYLLITSTRLTINLEESIRAINENPRCNFATRCWTALDLERELCRYPDLVRKHFPRSYATSLVSSPAWSDVVTQCRDQVDAEIHASVGRKYLPQVYVERSVRQGLQQFIDPPECRLDHFISFKSRISKLVRQSHDSILNGLVEIGTTLTDRTEQFLQEARLPIALEIRPFSTATESLAKHKAELEAQLRRIQETRAARNAERNGSTDRQTSTPHKAPRVEQIRKDIGDCTTLLRHLAALASIEETSEHVRHESDALEDKLEEIAQRLAVSEHTRVTYPSLVLFSEIREIFQTTRKLVGSLRQLTDNSNMAPLPTAALNACEQHLKTLRQLESECHTIERSARPVYMLVDRAGGGKTNLLCRMAQDIARDSVCCFVTAKSVLDPTADGIARYFASTYGPAPNDGTGLALAEEWCNVNQRPLVFIIDGINENTNPVAFNEALKQFVKQYYDRDVRFLVSCRDVYWEYFKDAFWDEHARVSSNTLYTFTAEEYKKALPLYLDHFHINAKLKKRARDRLRHPLLLRFFCEAYRGTSEQEPADVETLDNIRLKKLFDDYAERKFFEIRKRLNLADSREIEEYLFMIAGLMLANGSRLVPSEQVAHGAKELFGEVSITSMTSRYMQIRDEDILIEDRPTGTNYALKTGFVYDEFMEYVIAKSTVVNMNGDEGATTEPYLRAASEAIDALLSRREEFISVVGATEYVLTFIAEKSTQTACTLMAQLANAGFGAIACRAISKWPRELITRSVYEFVIDVHSERGVPHKVEQLAWMILETHCGCYPREGLGYAMRMELSTMCRPMRAFSFIARASQDVGDYEMLKACVGWVIETMRESALVTVADARSGDFKSGLRTLRVLLEKVSPQTAARERTEIWRQIQPLLVATQEMENKAIADNLRVVYRCLANRSRSYREFAAAWVKR